MKKKEWNEKERIALAAKLEGILGADLDPDEEQAIRDAISIISPEYAEAIEKDEQETAAWWDAMKAREAADPGALKRELRQLDPDYDKHLAEFLELKEKTDAWKKKGGGGNK